MPLIKAIACGSLVRTVKTVRREDLLAQGWAGPKEDWWLPTLLGPDEYAAAIAESAGQSPSPPVADAPKRRARAAH